MNIRKIFIRDRVVAFRQSTCALNKPQATCKVLTGGARPQLKPEKLSAVHMYVTSYNIKPELMFLKGY